MHRRPVALILGSLAIAALAGCDLAHRGIADFPLGIPDDKTQIIARPREGDPSMMDTHLHRRPVSRPDWP